MASSSVDAVSPVEIGDVGSGASLPEAMEVDAPPSTVDSELLSESSFQLVGDLAEITNEDYQMAEQVAEAYKKDEDATSLTLSGVNPGSFTMLQTATKVDLQKLLTELTEAMQRMLTKDSSVDQGTGTQPGPAVSGQGMGTDTKALVEFEKVTVDTYRIANGNLDDLRDLLTIFDKGYALTPAAFHRILESYGLAVKKLQHEKILLAEHVKKRDTTTIHTLEERETNMKAAASINVSDFSVPLKEPRVNPELSYSDLVPNNQRVLLRTQVVEEETDDPLFSSAPTGDRPPLKREFKDGQQSLFFHPQATKVLRMRAQMREDPPAKKTIQEKMEEEEGYLKRKHEGESGSSDVWQQIALAQTSISQAKVANKERQEQGQHKRQMLRPAVETLWSPTVQKVLESNALMPSVAVDFLSQDDLNLARTQHLDLKMYIKAKGNPCPDSLLLEEVPETPLDFWEVTKAADPPAGSGESNADLASRLPPGSMERKLAILDIINQHSQGQLRVWGGQWQKKWDELNIPGWAMSGTGGPGEPGPTSPSGHDPQLVLGSGTGRRRHWHRAVSTWSFPSLCHKLAHQNNLKEIYAIWQNMPLAVDPPTRGHHSAEKGRLKLQRHTAIRKEVKTFAQEMGLKKLPSDVDSWR
ncbi:unnamed protein product, partial [Cladocopium goreaui]